MQKKKMSIFIKIWLGISALIVGYFISMIMIQITGGKIKAELYLTSETLFPAATLSQKATAIFEKQTKLYQDAIMMGESTMIEEAAKESATVLDSLQQIINLKGLSRERSESIRNLKQSIETFTYASSSIYGEMASGEMGQVLVGKASENSKEKDELNNTLIELSNQFSDDLKSTIQSNIEMFGRQQRSTFILFVLVLVVCLTVVWLVIKKSIVVPVNNVITRLNEVTPEIDTASGHISDASQSLAEGASEQAAAIEETSSSLEEMSSMTKQNALHASEADNLMKNASKVIGKANQAMTDLTNSMDQISTSSEETSKIIKTIDEIAFQTNLLALNAAVEAARAGEAGAGFAVVADEVRSLAMRAADAAKNTSVLIEGTVKRIKDGTALVTEANSAFSEVSETSAAIGNLVGEIASASHEQADGIEQINKAVVEMNKVVQKNAAGAEESASASEDMGTQAENLKKVVADLVDIIGGYGGDREVVPKRNYRIRSVANKLPTSSRTVRVPKKEISFTQKVKAISPEDVIPKGDSDFQDF